LHVWESFLKVNGWESDYESVAKILRYYKRKIKSEGTKANVCQILKSFCLFVRKNPDEVVGLGVEEASRLVQNYVDSLAEKGISIRYVNASLAFLKTFFKVNGFKESKSLQVERHYQPPRYRKTGEYIPTSAEIYDMSLSSGSARNKAVVLTLYTSGLRNSTLRALLYRDVMEEVEEGMKVVKLPVYPEMKKIDDGACKGNIPYYSFMSSEATEAVRGYFAERNKMNKSIEGDEPMFASESTNVPAEVGRRTPIMKKSLEAMVKRAARKAGVKRWQDVRPHCLRKAFEYALRNAGLDPKDQEFLMGHILPGTQDAYYDKTKVENLRMKYAKVNFFLERGGLTEDARKKQILDTAKILGYSEDRIKRIEEALAKCERVDDALEQIKKLNNDSYKQSESHEERQSKMRGEKREVRIVHGEQTLIRFMNDGWDLVTELVDDKFVMQKSFDESMPRGT
jgi:site-specific recombinase XerD